MVKRISKNIISFIKSEYLPFVILLGLMVLLHLYIGGNTGDDIYFSAILDNQGLFEFLNARYHQWASRLIIEAALVSISPHENLWRVIDIFMIMLLVISISKIFIRTNKKYLNSILCALFLCYPFIHMYSAGWIATTLNYLWPLAFGMYSLIPLSKIIYGEKIRTYEYITSCLALLIAANVEQMAAILTGVYLLFVIYLLMNKKTSKFIIIQFVISVASLLFILTCPGNANRLTSEIKTWFPDFEMLSTTMKIQLGVLDTLSHFFLRSNILMSVFTGILLINVWNKCKVMYKRLISGVPFITCLIFGWGSMLLQQQFPWYSELLDSILVYKYDINILKIYLVILFLLIVVVCILFSIYIIFGFSWMTLLSYIILGAGFVARVIMGFSPTLYASSTRTYIFFYFSLIITSLLLIENLSLTNKKRYLCSIFLVVVGVGVYSYNVLMQMVMGM